MVIDGADWIPSFHISEESWAFRIPLAILQKAIFYLIFLHYFVLPLRFDKTIIPRRSRVVQLWPGLCEAALSSQNQVNFWPPLKPRVRTPKENTDDTSWPHIWEASEHIIPSV